MELLRSGKTPYPTLAAMRRGCHAVFVLKALATLLLGGGLTACGPSKREVELETSLRYERQAVETLSTRNRAQAGQIQRLEENAEKSAARQAESAGRWAKAQQELRILRQTKINLEEVVRTTEAAKAVIARQDERQRAEDAEKERRDAALRARQISAWKIAQIPEIEAGAETVRIKVRRALREGAIAEASHISETMRQFQVKSEYQNPLESEVRYETRQKMETELTPFPDLIYIDGLNTVAENEERDLTLYPAGLREDPTRADSPKRLRQYALTPDRAAQLLAEHQPY